MIRSFTEAEAGFTGQALDYLSRKVRMGIQTGADRRAAEGEFGKMGARVFQPGDSMGDLAGITAEFLAKAHRGGVLQMRSADLEDAIEFRGLAGQRVVQFLEGGDELALDLIQ